MAARCRWAEGSSYSDGGTMGTRQTDALGGQHLAPVGDQLLVAAADRPDLAVRS